MPMNNNDPVRKKGDSKSEEQFRQVIRVSGIGIFDHDHQTDTIYWSPEQRMIYGWGPDETVTLQKFLEQVYSEDRERIAAAVQIAHNPLGDGKFDVDHRIVRRDGAIRWLSTRSQTFFQEENGKVIPVRTVGAVLDITNRKEIEETLYRSEERLQLAIRASHIGIFDHDHLTENLHWSAEMREILGVGTEEEVTLQTYFDLIPPEDLLKITNAVNMAHSPEGDGFFNIEHRIILPNGEIRWLNLRSQTSFKGTGLDRRPERTVGVVIDITEGKVSEIALQESEARLAEAQKIAHLGYWERNMKTDAAWWSDECYRIFGLEPGKSAIDYQSFLNRIHPEDRKLVGDAVYAAMRQKAPYIVDYRIVLPDQTERIIHSQAEVIFDSMGKPEKLSGTVLDVTDQRKMEREMAKTQKLESLGLLAGGIAHDFNNILTAIVGNISLARVSIDPENPIIEILAAAEMATLRAKELTSQLLTFSKGGAPVKTLKSIVCLVRDSAEFVLRGSNVSLEFTGAEKSWPVEVDEGQIAQVIQNLVINAQQAMPNGGVISICLDNVSFDSAQAKERVVPAGDYVKISVRDTGIGISPEHLKNVFDPFFTTKENGSGLGLSTSYSIIKRHHGALYAESRPGVGSIFTLLLPANIKVTPPPREKPKEKVRFGSGRILLMDDDPLVREIAGKILEHLGYEVTYAKSGEEAITLFQEKQRSERPFKLVILDLTVPAGMSGEETMKKLIEIDPNIKGIVSSGYSNNPVMSEFKKYGFSGKISKPYKIEELSSVIASLLQENRSSSPESQSQSLRDG